MESIVVNHLYEQQVREKLGAEGKRETLLLSTVDYWENQTFYYYLITQIS